VHRLELHPEGSAFRYRPHRPHRSDPVDCLALARLVPLAGIARAEHQPDARRVMVRHLAALARPLGLVRLGIPRPLLEAEPMRRGPHLERLESRLELPPVQFVRSAPA
jgi:hypothetical protein